MDFEHPSTKDTQSWISITGCKKDLKEEIEVRLKIQKENVELIDRLQQALKEIKTLRGIVPICASCKRIRDDQGFWSQVEIYVQNH